MRHLTGRGLWVSVCRLLDDGYFQHARAVSVLLGSGVGAAAMMLRMQAPVAEQRAPLAEQPEEEESLAARVAGRLGREEVGVRWGAAHVWLLLQVGHHPLFRSVADP